MLLLVRGRLPTITVVTLSEVSALLLPPRGGASAARGFSHEAVGLPSGSLAGYATLGCGFFRFRHLIRDVHFLQVEVHLR